MFFSQISINSIQIESSVYGVKVYAPTSICSKSGGMCVHRDDCAPDQFALRSGMCGYNDKNVECCFEGKFRMYFFLRIKSVYQCSLWGFPGLVRTKEHSSQNSFFNVLDRMKPKIVILLDFKY